MAQQKAKLWVLLGMLVEDAEDTYEYTPSVIATMDETLYDVMPVEDFDKWLDKQKKFFCGDMIHQYTFREIWVDLDAASLRSLFNITTIPAMISA
jgi:hypothetical protein